MKGIQKVIIILMGWLSSLILIVVAQQPSSPPTLQPLTIAKQPLQRNPKLKIFRWEGSKLLLEQLQHDLRTTNWFDLTWGEDAEYFLAGKSDRVGKDGIKLELELSNQHGDSYRIEVSDTDLISLSHRVVDTLILYLFQRPGICRVQIAYVIEKENKTKTIMIADYDGGRSRPLASHQWITEPTFSYQYGLMGYTAYLPHQTRLVLYDMNKNRWRWLSTEGGLNNSLRFAPDGQQFAFCSSRDGTVDIYLGHLQYPLSFKRITNDEVAESCLAWSPESHSLCYVAQYNGRPTLYLIDLRTNQRRQVFSEPIEINSPDWSLVSKAIVCSIRRGNQYTLAYFNPQQNPPQLFYPVHETGDWENPVWMPDGRHVLCVRNTGSQRLLYIVDTWFGKLQELRSAGTQVSLPACSLPPEGIQLLNRYLTPLPIQ